VAIIVGVFAVYRYVPVGKPRVASSRDVAVEPRWPSRAGARPTLWLLSIGVSHYKEVDIGLQFADADARAMATALEGQGHGPIYSETKSLVLTNERVTRESILGGIERFLGEAAPDDVTVIFMAGHGVQDRATGSYYFLPYPANAENLLTEGLRMSDFDEMIRVLRRNVRRVVLMLDTCHAGALRLTSRAVLSADDLAAQVSGAEGLFLLAAAKPGEESKETAELGHGAFTYAMLEGLTGAADADHDGVVLISELFGYVAGHVPRLTAGRQHPYHKEEGTDLTFAAVEMKERESAPAPAASEPTARELAEKPAPNTIAVMEFGDLRKDPKNDWIGKALRAGLNTELSKVRALHVCSPILIDRRIGKGADDLTVARQLGIGKILRGSFVVVGTAIRVDLEIVDVPSGMQVPSESVEGQEAKFFDLQKSLAFATLQQLPVELSQAEGSSIEEETNTSVAAYRLLQQSLGTAEGSRATGKREVSKTPRPKVKPQSLLDRWLPKALAAELTGDSNVEVRELLDEYRQAHEQKDLNRLAALYVSFTARQREAVRAYLEGATELTVDLQDVQLEVSDQDIVVSCTRRDSFIDRRSRKHQHLEIRLTQLLVREGGKWKIADER